MKVAIISDLHSNLEALMKVGEEIKDMGVYCLGDLVGYGANPNEVISWIRNRNAVTVLGNHDYASLTTDTSWFNPSAAKAIEWTIKKLTIYSRNYLKTIPQKRFVNIEDIKIMIVHGSPIDPLFEYVHTRTHEYLFEYYLDKFKVDIICLGHTHEPFVWKKENKFIVNPGSVGQPRTGKSEANFLILMLKKDKIEFEQRSVRYDINAAARKIVSSGLPPFYAQRLYSGI